MFFYEYAEKRPTAALVSELVLIHDGHFIVKAELREGDTVKASTLAIADKLGVAQTMAQTQTMALVGCDLTVPRTSPELFSQSKQQNDKKIERRESRAAQAAAYVAQLPEPEIEFEDPAYSPPAKPEIKSEIAPPAPKPSGTSVKIAQLLDKLGWTTDVELCVLQNLFGASKPNREALDLAEKLELVQFLEECDRASTAILQSKLGNKFAAACMEREFGKSELFLLDLSQARAFANHLETIIQIGTEIGRLGWSQDFAVSQLESQYGVKSRSSLSSEQAIEFLSALKVQQF